MKKHITKGTTRECLADFFSRFGVSERLIKFVQITPNSEERWRLGMNMPIGENLLRTQYFLQFVGYELEEFNGLPSDLIAVGKCIVLNILTVDHVTKTIGMDQSKRFFEYFRRERSVVPEKLESMIKLWTPNAILIEEKSSQICLGLHSVHAERNAEPDPVVEEFSQACRIVRERGKQLLDGPIEKRNKMRRIMGVGKEPPLHLTWETINLLLKERTEHEG